MKLQCKSGRTIGVLKCLLLGAVMCPLVMIVFFWGPAMLYYGLTGQPFNFGG